ncbi:dihydrofolate reductase family protein [Demequina soli]|uniref:dihydrofolate reductase family protein n=1 Tax=Demequina soli TaxID=1638987 RepID=UPI000782B007|nr:dihydrofolate reductase family protein [Demequina soli]
MARLIYAINCSLDGYINDANGDFDWSEPDPELHDFFAGLERSTGTHLYGRRLHETMAVWHDFYADPAIPPLMRRFAEAWIDTDTIVYSRTIAEPGMPRARVLDRFDAAEVAALKDTSERDLSIGGATLAARALEAGLVDEIVLAVVPVIVGGGTRALPAGLRLDLELVEHRAFPRGAVLLRYLVRRDGEG